MKVFQLRRAAKWNIVGVQAFSTELADLDGEEGGGDHAETSTRSADLDTAELGYQYQGLPKAEARYFARFKQVQTGDHGSDGDVDMSDDDMQLQTSPRGPTRGHDEHRTGNWERDEEEASFRRGLEVERAKASKNLGFLGRGMRALDIRGATGARGSPTKKTVHFAMAPPTKDRAELLAQSPRPKTSGVVTKGFVSHPEPGARPHTHDPSARPPSALTGKALEAYNHHPEHQRATTAEILRETMTAFQTLGPSAFELDSARDEIVRRNLPSLDRGASRATESARDRGDRAVNSLKESFRSYHDGHQNRKVMLHTYYKKKREFQVALSQERAKTKQNLDECTTMYGFRFAAAAAPSSPSKSASRGLSRGDAYGMDARDTAGTRLPSPVKVNRTHLYPTQPPRTAQTPRGIGKGGGSRLFQGVRRGLATPAASSSRPHTTRGGHTARQLPTPPAAQSLMEGAELCGQWI